MAGKKREKKETKNRIIFFEKRRFSIIRFTVAFVFIFFISGGAIVLRDLGSELSIGIALLGSTAAAYFLAWRSDGTLLNALEGFSLYHVVSEFLTRKLLSNGRPENKSRNESKK